MILPSYVRKMAAYNGEMNRRVYAAAARLTDERRLRDEGAFWHSIHGTLCHILWADLTWMSRLAGWPKPGIGSGESDRLIADFGDLASARRRTDEDLATWADTVDEAWIARPLTWFSGVSRNTIEAPRALLLVHFFNHQTHHRGQVHALLTRAGETTGDTDLPWVLPPDA